MSGSNQFRAIATGVGANALTPAAYAALTTLLSSGYQSGTASSAQINTTLRQSSFVSTAIAQAIADMTGAAVNDDGVIANFENQFISMLQQQSYLSGVAGGTADAITLTANPAIVTLTNGLSLLVRAGLANATTTPTFSPNGLTARTIVKGNGLPLAVGDISGAGHWLEMQYDTALTAWVLQNPANGVKPSSGGFAGIIPLNASATLTLAQLGSVIQLYGATTGQTITFPAVASVTSGKGYWIANISSVPFTISANAAEQIELNVPGVGAIYGTTFVLQPGDSTFIVSRGDVWYEQQGVRAVNGPTVRAALPATYTTSTALSAADIGRLSVYYNASTGGTFTLPPTSAIYVGACISCICTGAGILAVTANTGQNIVALGSVGVASITLGLTDSITLLWNGTSWIQVSGAAQFGVGQTPQIIALGAGAGQRQAGTTYTNTWGKPIEVNITFTSVGSIGDWIISIGGSANKRGGFVYNPGGSTYTSSLIFTVPVGATYSVAAANITGSFTITQWTEQR